MTQDWKEGTMSHVDEGTLHAYLDDALSSDERRALEAHLGQCAVCRATLTEERALLERASALLGSARPVERAAPPLEQLRRKPPRSPWHVRMPFAWAASIVVALGIGYYVGPQEQAPSTVAPPTGSRVAMAPLEDKAAPVRQQVSPRPSAAGPRRRPSAPAGDELVRSEVRAHADSYAASGQTRVGDAGAVAMNSPQLRNATPAAAEPALPEAVIVSAVGRMPITTQWPVISRGVAASLLGADPVGLPGLSTRRIQRNPSGDGTVVVEQTLDASTVIQIFQRPAAAEAGVRAPRAAQAPARADRLARFVGPLRVEIAGPLTSDSLNRLLEQVEPLP
jgi:anti-sigma factor RsiW